MLNMDNNDYLIGKYYFESLGSNGFIGSIIILISNFNKKSKSVKMC